MPKKSIKAEVKSFIKGFITEASSLNFPADASAEEQNFELNTDGSRSRRLGIDIEQGYLTHSFPYDDTYMISERTRTFEWINAGSIPGNTVTVVQYGTNLKFFQAGINSVSNFGYIGYLDISSLGAGTNQYSLTSVDGKLVITAGVKDIGVVSYALGTFTLELKRILVRDVWGVETGFSTEMVKVENDPTYRPTSIVSDNYNYNIYNQGWGIPRTITTIGTVEDVPVALLTYHGFAPSYSDSIWTGLQFQAKTTTDPAYERVFLNLYKETTGTSGSTAKGSFIIDAMDRSNSRNAAIAANKVKYPSVNMGTYAAPTDYTTGGPTVACEFAGRVWYSGFSGTRVGGDGRSPDYSNYIFFSQLVKNSKDIVKCYQEGDPTSREANDLVDTDGGFIRIMGAGNIIRILAMSSSLLVFASNGVWAISGGAEYGFTATNYKVDKISSFGCLSPTSVCEYAGVAFFWSYDGIYAAGMNERGAWSVDSMSKATIQKYYDKLDVNSKSRAIGFADNKGRKLRWIITEGSLIDNTLKQTELVFDTLLKAFSKNVIGYSNTYLAGYTKTTSGGDLRYLLVYKVAGSRYFTFASYRDTSFVDWKTLTGTGIDAKAFILTGSSTADDSSTEKQIPYLTMHFKRTESGTDLYGTPLNQSSCLVRTQWEWANSIASNKWSPLRQAYRYREVFYSPDLGYDTGFELVSSKNKVRGRGRAFALYMETEPGKDCKVLGWNINLNGNAYT